MEAAATLQPLPPLQPAVSPPPAVDPSRPKPAPAPSNYDSVSASPSPPGSPKIYCSQYRQAQHDEDLAAAEPDNAQQPPPLVITVEEKVTHWRQRCASPAVTEESDRYPTPPGAPDDDYLSSDTVSSSGFQPSTRLTSKHLLVRHRDRVWVRKDHRDPRGLGPARPALLRRNRLSRPTGPRWRASPCISLL